MSGFLDIIIVCVILSNFALLGSGRIHIHIRVVGMQGLLVGFLPILLGPIDQMSRNIILSLVSMGIKGVLFPILLFYTVRTVRIRREIDPYVGYPFAMVSGIAFLLISVWLSGKLVPAAAVDVHVFLLAVALSTSFVGLFCIVSRKLAISQAIGYFVFENGIWMFGSELVEGIPLLLELAILLDVFVAVFVLGIAIYQINKRFEHIDVTKIDSLKG